MNAGDVIDIWRRHVDDVAEPVRWSDEEALEFLNDAQNEAARRTRYFVDSTTAAIAQLAVTQASGGLVALDPRVLFVRNVRFAGKRPLARRTMQDMQTMDPFWQDAGTGLPCVFIPDYQTGKLLFWPPPDADYIGLATVVRDPLAEVTKEDDALELPDRYLRNLRHWMAYRAYMKPDEETYDPARAAQSLALFEQEFGPRSSAIDEAWIAREQMDGDGSYA